MGNAPTLGTSVFGSVDAAATVYVVAGATGFPDPFGGLPVIFSPLIYVVNGDGISVTITDCDTAASGALVIPQTIEGKPVTSIGDYAFASCTSLTSVIIPEGVTSIGSEAFSYCSRLTSVTIPGSVTSIGYGAWTNITTGPVR